MNENSVFRFFENENVRLRQLGRIRASENCLSAMRSLRGFLGSESDLTFEGFNGELMEGYEAFLKNRGLMRNTSSYYMRCLRSVYNRAVEHGLTEDQHPFRHVYTNRDKTVKRALRMETVQKIKALDFPDHPELDFARDMFLFSFYTRGMSFVDMAYLRKADIHGSHLVYRRRKTGQLLRVEWLPCMQAIIDKYPRNPTRFLLPIITLRNEDDRLQYKRKLRSVNRNLKVVAKRAKLRAKLSTYFARHSWASLARKMQIQISVISKALGHDNEVTTQIYLDSIQSTVVDEANRQLLAWVGVEHFSETGD